MWLTLGARGSRETFRAGPNLGGRLEGARTGAPIKRDSFKGDLKGVQAKGANGGIVGGTLKGEDFQF
jgi:hypothetical protein